MAEEKTGSPESHAKNEAKNDLLIRGAAGAKDEAQVPRSPQDQNRSQQQVSNGRMRWGSIPDRISIGIGMVAAIIVFFYTYYARQQWLTLEASLQETRKVAESARGQLTEMHNSSVNSQRAWVGISQPIHPTAIRLGPPHIVLNSGLTIKNFGSSPAFDIVPIVIIAPGFKKIDVAARSACISANEWFEFKEPNMRQSAQNRRQGNTLFPNQELYWRFQAGDDTEPGDRHLDVMYVLGCIVYRDIFGQKRQTQFCVHSGVPARSITTETVFFPCSVYNEAN